MDNQTELEVSSAGSAKEKDLRRLPRLIPCDGPAHSVSGGWNRLLPTPMSQARVLVALACQMLQAG